jgi:hypothetical protein
VTVNGKATGVGVTFTKAVSSGFLGFSGDTGYILIGVVVAVAVVTVALLVLRGRKTPTKSSMKEATKEEKDSTSAESEKTDGKPDTKSEK